MTDFSEKEFDVIGFAKSIMSEVESVRSFEKVKDDKTGEGFQLPTESRLNAFFRLVGLPYFVDILNQDEKKDKKSDFGQFINSGFAKRVSSELADKNIANSVKLKYINSGKTYYISELLNNREGGLRELSEKIGSNDMNERMAKAICSPLGIAPNFTADRLGEPGTFVPKTPQGGSDTQNSRETFKQLFPLIPSYQKILPLANNIARPFTLAVSERRIDRDTVLRKPFLEQVIRTRFVVYGSAQKDREKATERDITESLTQFLGQDIFSKAFPKGLPQVNIVEEFVINKFLDAIRSLARRWSKMNQTQRVKLLREIRPIITIKTSSARISPFGKRIEISSSIEGTKDGNKINFLNVLIAEEEALISLLPTDENEETKPKESVTKNITPGALQNSFTELLQYNLNRNKEEKTALEAKIKKNINSLEKLRLEIDMMTGEFTGLSVADVVIVIAALFIMDRNKLLNLLDKYTVDYMKSDKVLSSIVSGLSPTAKSAMEAIQELEKVVNNLFTLFQKEVDVANNRKSQTRRLRSVRTSETQSNNPTCIISDEET